MLFIAMCRALYTLPHVVFATILPTGYLYSYFTDIISDLHRALSVYEGLSHVVSSNPHISCPISRTGISTYERRH